MAILSWLKLINVLFDFIWMVSCSWSNHNILLLMIVAEKVLLLLVIFLTDKSTKALFSSVLTTTNTNQSQPRPRSSGESTPSFSISTVESYHQSLSISWTHQVNDLLHGYTNGHLHRLWRVPDRSNICIVIAQQVLQEVVFCTVFRRCWNKQTFCHVRVNRSHSSGISAMAMPSDKSMVISRGKKIRNPTKIWPILLAYVEIWSDSGY